MNAEATPEVEKRESLLRRLPAKVMFAFGGALGALAAASCCLVPLALMSLGIGGAWLGNLTVLAPYGPYIIPFTLVFLGAGFHLVYRTPKRSCDEGAVCARAVPNRLVKGALWSGTVLVTIDIATRYVAPLVLGVS